jgi:GrpB-like predicted nucleotidyltransferase (UPF0157 family)
MEADMNVRRLESGWSNATEDRIAIEPYDLAWPAAFEREADALRQVLPTDVKLTIEHVGSTAVPRLAAKPVIDIVLVVSDRSAWPKLVEPIESLGYVFWADNPDPDRLFFVKGMPPYGGGRTHHVHVRTPEDAAEALLFRDHLRSHPETAAEYEALKRSLASRHPTDREAYTDAKDEFVQKILTRARRP